MALRLITSNKSFIVQVNSTQVLADVDAEACKFEILKHKKSYSLIMLDLSGIQMVSNSALKILVEIGTAIADKSCRLMVTVSESLNKIIHEQGYSEVLPCYVGVVPISGASEDSIAKSEIDSNIFFKVTLPAIRDNLKIYAKKSVTFGEKFSCSQENRPPADIAGVGGFFCNHRRGNLILSFTKDSYLKIVSSIMKAQFTQIEPIISDWAAELVNSILGKVKSDLRSDGFIFSAGIPTVLLGKDLEVMYSSRATHPSDLVKCSGNFGEFFVELVLTHSD